MKMSSYRYRKSHCGDKTVVISSYLHNGISYSGKMSSLYWIGPWLFNHNVVGSVAIRDILERYFHITNMNNGTIYITLRGGYHHLITPRTTVACVVAKPSGDQFRGRNIHPQEPTETGLDYILQYLSCEWAEELNEDFLSLITATNGVIRATTNGHEENLFAREIEVMINAGNQTHTQVLPEAQGSPKLNDSHYEATLCALILR